MLSFEAEANGVGNKRCGAGSWLRVRPEQLPGAVAARVQSFGAEVSEATSRLCNHAGTAKISFQEVLRDRGTGPNP